MRLLQSVDHTVGTVGELGSKALDTLAPTLDNLTKPGGVLTQTVNTLGQTVQTTIDATGNIVEKTMDTAGGVLSTKDLGNLLKLPAVGETKNATGQTVKTVRDTSGRLIEFITDNAGKLLGYRVAPSRQTGGTGTQSGGGTQSSGG
jgi:YD repeat-containing protein